MFRAPAGICRGAPRSRPSPPTFKLCERSVYVREESLFAHPRWRPIRREADPPRIVTAITAVLVLQHFERNLLFLENPRFCVEWRDAKADEETIVLVANLLEHVLPALPLGREFYLDARSFDNPIGIAVGRPHHVESARCAPPSDKLLADFPALSRRATQYPLERAVLPAYRAILFVF